MYHGDALFRGDDLGGQLRGLDMRIQPVVNSQINENSLSRSDEELATAIIEQFQVSPLTVDFDTCEKFVEETRVTVSDFGRQIEIDGVKATRAFSFTGDSSLFYKMPSSYSSMLPHGTVSASRVTIGISGRSDDAERLKQELDQQQELLKQYIGNQERQINAYNLALPGKVMSFIASRRDALSKLVAARGILG